MKKSVLIFGSYYLPGYRGGGPIRSIANIVSSLSDTFKFRIVTSDRDLHDKSPYDEVNVDRWNEVQSAEVFYARRTLSLFRNVVRILRSTPYDVLYLNSFFDARFTLLPLILSRVGFVPKKPIVLAPRGEFSEGALEIKAKKKKTFIRLAKVVGLYDEVIWHAASGLEAEDIAKAMSVPRERIMIAPNITASIQGVTSDVNLAAAFNESGTHERLKVCFLSRISPKKNLDFALKVLSGVRIPIQFDIYGPRELPSYWDSCQEIISTLPGNISARYCGSVAHEEVRATIAKYHLFFLPTQGENFGHVFFEAWSVGVPVLTSDRTPWRELHARGLGWDIELAHVEGFAGAIEACACRSPHERALHGARCVDFVRKFSEKAASGDLHRELFTRASSEACAFPS